MFLRQRRDLLDLHRGAELDLVAGDRRAARVAGDGGVDLELLEHLGEPLDDLVGRRRSAPCAGVPSRSTRAVGERVDDVARERELLGADRATAPSAASSASRVLRLVGAGSARRRSVDRDLAVVVRAVDERVLERLVVDRATVRGWRLRFIGLRCGRPRSGLCGRAPCRGRSRMRSGTACSGVPVTTRTPNSDDQHQQRARRRTRLLSRSTRIAENRKPDRSPGLADGGLSLGRGTPCARWTRPEDAAADGGPADDLAPGRAVAVGVAQGAPGDDGQQDRHGPGQQADAAGGDAADAVADAAGDLPPDRRRPTTMASAEEREADAVTALLRRRAPAHRGRCCGRSRPRHRRAPSQMAVEQARMMPLQGSAEGTRTGSCRRARRAAACAQGLALRGRLLAGLAAGRPLARRGRRSGRHDRKAKPEPETSHGPTPQARGAVSRWRSPPGRVPPAPERARARARRGEDRGVRRPAAER